MEIVNPGGNLIRSIGRSGFAAKEEEIKTAEKNADAPIDAPKTILPISVPHRSDSNERVWRWEALCWTPSHAQVRPPCIDCIRSRPKHAGGKVEAFHQCKDQGSRFL